MPRGREHLLFRHRQLRESRLADHVGGRPSGRDAARYQPYGEEGLLTAEIDLTAATGLLARVAGVEKTAGNVRHLGKMGLATTAFSREAGIFFEAKLKLPFVSHRLSSDRRFRLR